MITAASMRAEHARLAACDITKEPTASLLAWHTANCLAPLLTGGATPRAAEVEAEINRRIPVPVCP